MSNRRLIRHSAGVLMTLLLLATLIVPAANAQVVANPVAGTGAIQGIVVDANTREPLVEVCEIGVIVPEQIVRERLDGCTRRRRLAAGAREDVDHVASRPRRVRGRSAGPAAEAVRPGSTPTTVPALLGSGPTPAWR